jgi:hypothetical protein
MRVLLELEGGEPWSQRIASILARQSQWSAYGTSRDSATVGFRTIAAVRRASGDAWGSFSSAHVKGCGCRR